MKIQYSFPPGAIKEFMIALNTEPYERFDQFLKKKYSDFYYEYIERHDKPQSDELPCEFNGRRITDKIKDMLWDFDEVPTNFEKYGWLSIDFEDMESRIDSIPFGSIMRGDEIKSQLFYCSDRAGKIKLNLLVSGLKKEIIDLLKYELQCIENHKSLLECRMVASGLDITNFKEEPVESSYNSTSEQLKAKQVEAELYFKDKENKFNKVPLIQVYKYFMQLVNGSDVPFLKEQDVFSFIDKAFCLSDNIDKLEFTNTKDYKLIIWKLFHTFYEGCKENALYDKRKGTKKDYVELISNNFTNWEYSAIFENFGKAESKKWKKLQEFK